MTTVSVIVPTRNRSALLSQTLCSVLWQRDVQLEVIVVDEASTDDTPQVIAGLADSRVTVLRHSAPQGLSAARNRGAGLAQGEWLAFVDDDDVWGPDKLAHQVTTADDLGRDWVYGGTVNIGMNLEIVSWSRPPSANDVVAALPRYNPIPGGGSNVILRRRLLEQVGGFDERFTACEDWEMWARLVRSGPPACVSRPLMGYRLHSGNMSLDTTRIRRNVQMLERLHATTADWGRLNRWLADSCLRMERHTEAIGHFARAAVQGQARGVASDLAAILRRRVSRRVGTIATDRSWTVEGEAWLSELERCTSTKTIESKHRSDCG